MRDYTRGLASRSTQTTEASRPRSRCLKSSRAALVSNVVLFSQGHDQARVCPSLAVTLPLYVMVPPIAS